MPCDGNQIKWIEDTFGECISTATEKAGFFIGILSTAIWMYAQIPQIVMNFKRKSVDGLSFIFIVLLNVGDLSNLLGALINHGLLTQCITATWFMFVDICCLVQYIWYHWIQGHCCHKEEDYSNIIDAKPPVMPIIVAAAAATNPYEPPQLYGTLLGWISAASYISSRLPQIITNFQRKRTEGLSIQFFWSAVLGNTTYALSIFLKDYHWDYIWQQFPWLVGSAGILFFDFTVLVQFLVYKNRKENLAETTSGAAHMKPYIADQLY